MGIAADIIKDLIRIKKTGLCDGWESVCELGAQQLSPSFFRNPDLIDDLFKVWGRENPFNEAAPNYAIIPDGELPASMPQAKVLWEAIGFGDYLAIDFAKDSGILPLDLNFDLVPDEHLNRYNLVTNFGTTEHVCNQANAFSILHDLTKVGGVMFHVLPASGMFNHGLVNYTPKFFWKLCEANDYEMVFFDFLPSRAPYAVPENIIRMASSFGRDTSWAEQYQIDDIALKVMVRKRHNRDFVLPVDLERLDVLKDRELRKRYPMPLYKTAWQRIWKKLGFGSV